VSTRALGFSTSQRIALPAGGTTLEVDEQDDFRTLVEPLP
jgi:hypothetical protein